MYNFICVLFYFTFKRKTLSTTKEVCGVLHKWLTFDYLFELCMESHLQCGLFQGLACFVFLFLFLILSHCILYQLLIHHFEGGGGNVALLFVSFFIFFIIIIKGLTFSSHHCEITDLSE